LLNVYSPNNTAEQGTFYSGILNTLEEATHDSSCQLTIREDFNAHSDPELDSAEGKTIRKESVKKYNSHQTGF